MEDLNSITIEEALKAYKKYDITFEFNDGEGVGYHVEIGRFIEGENASSEKGCA